MENNYSELTTSRIIIKIDEGCVRHEKDLIVRETTLTVHINSTEVATLVCSPRDQKYLAVGFLCGEGILKKREDIISVDMDQEQGAVYVKTRTDLSFADRLTVKRRITPSAGGSGTTVSADGISFPSPVRSHLQVRVETALNLANQLQERSQLFQRTGGVHNAALAKGEEILIFQEDIGRHNTLDKIHGQCFLEGISRDDKMIIFSGRVSTEILLKVARMGVPVLISRSAPTDRALQLAEKLNITVLGFVRGKRLTIYTGQEQVIF
ncbi:MAG: formate dehydrogenase accessory sulfurtransferase FdhD [Thermacetogeniaceae bacterium]|jgi:FdhD protein|nr:formate dehydrogenase accessory sulfurtransferase FdhD [Thermoanaerobacterales bacterium]HAF17164.1 formate dehydrogenase accessory sulfurtransferase FdhD [Peptococcaceae bacterium]